MKTELRGTGGIWGHSRELTESLLFHRLSWVIWMTLSQTWNRAFDMRVSDGRVLYGRSYPQNSRERPWGRVPRRALCMCQHGVELGEFWSVKSNDLRGSVWRGTWQVCSFIQAAAKHRWAYCMRARAPSNEHESGPRYFTRITMGQDL